MRTLTLVACLLAVPAFHAQNLLLNGDFEGYAACPTTFGELGVVHSWQQVEGHTGTPDFLHTCAAGTPAGVPVNAFGDQAPSSGNGYAGFTLYNGTSPNFREYLQGHLFAPLVAGMAYNFTLNVSLSDNAQLATPDLALYFSNTPYSWSGGNSAPLTTLTPQVVLSPTVTSKTGWTTVTASFEATGGEQYVIIGNFKDDATTTTLSLGSGTTNDVYVFVDDAVLHQLVPLNVTLVDFSGSCNAGVPELHWEVLSEEQAGQFVIESSDGTAPFQQLATIAENAAGSGELQTYTYHASEVSQETYYRLSHVDANGNRKTYDPVYVSCEPAPDAPFLHYNAAGLPQLEVTVAAEQLISCTVLDARGAVLERQALDISKGATTIQLSLAGRTPGMYLVRLEGETVRAAIPFTLF